jgi:myo-inositol-1(or 4)-monophosphatase
MALPNADELVAAATEAARLGAGELRRYFGSMLTIAEKGHARDLVTQADTASEQAIIGLLAPRWPEIGVLAEESGVSRVAREATWVIDPLDGTLNFTHGYPVFCISIACVDRHGPIAGVIYDPQRDELFSAARGRGASMNGRRLQVSAVENLSGGIFTTGWPYFPPARRRHAGHVFTEVMVAASDGRRGGAAALDLAYVAAGRQEAHYELTLAPHDVAAGVLLITEAGGRVEALAPPGATGWLPGILASNGRALHEEIASLIVAPLGVERRPLDFGPLFT